MNVTIVLHSLGAIMYMQPHRIVISSFTQHSYGSYLVHRRTKMNCIGSCAISLYLSSNARPSLSTTTIGIFCQWTILKACLTCLMQLVPLLMPPASSCQRRLLNTFARNCSLYGPKYLRRSKNAFSIPSNFSMTMSSV